MDSRLANAHQIRTTNFVSVCNKFVIILYLVCIQRFHVLHFVYCRSNSLKWIYYRAELDILLPPNNKDGVNAEIELKSCTEVYYAASRFLSLFKEKSIAYSERLEHLCRYLLTSLESEVPKFSYIGVALNKDLSVAWIRHIKKLLYKCCVCMEKLKPGN